MADIIDTVFLFSYDETWPTISIGMVRSLIDEHDDHLPENCFLQDLLDDFDDDEVGNTCVRCCTVNDDDAKFCKECGVKAEQNDAVEICSMTWDGDRAYESFQRIFVERVVSHIVGRVHGAVSYGDEAEIAVPWHTAYFIIEDGKLHWAAPRFDRAPAPDFATVRT